MGSKSRVRLDTVTTLERAIAVRLKRDGDGLVPAVIQEASSRDVLMVGWMADEALARTIASGRSTFWSRSRQDYWVKGEASGNTPSVQERRRDRQGDTLRGDDGQTGPDCHPGAWKRSR